MNIIKTAGLIGLGYMLRDTNVLKGRYYHYSSDTNLGEYFRELAINKLDMIFYGCERHSKPSTRIPYNMGDRYRSFIKYSGQAHEPTIAQELRRFDTKEKAMTAYDKFYEMIGKYGSVSVSDWNEIYYELMPCSDELKIKSCYTDSRYGWTEKPEQDIRRKIDGNLNGCHLIWYEIHLPSPQKL